MEVKVVPFIANIMELMLVSRQMTSTGSPPKCREVGIQKQSQMLGN